MKIRPLGDKIVIKVIEDTEQTTGGIFIPDSAKEKPQKGEVIAVGEGKTLDSGEKETKNRKIWISAKKAVSLRRKYHIKNLYYKLCKKHKL